MSTDLPKTYDPASVEPAADKVWLEENLFHAEPNDSGEPFCIVIPPPNVTAALHLGHALNNTLQDILIRWHRMKGNNTCWIPGTDHAGIATQTVVEKRVLAEEGKRRTDFQRDEFVQKIQAWKDEYERKITEQLLRMGCSCDYARQAFTMDEPRARAVREAFFQLFKDGLIYRGKRLVNWDPVTQTALADDEVEMEELDGHFYYLRYPILEVPSERGMGVSPMQHGRDAHATLRFVTVATTRPETMLGDTAVAINPKDPRAAQLRGKKVRLPIVNRIIPIIEDDYVVLPVNMGGDENDPKSQFATGFLKVTPAHDPNDYDIGQRHNLPIVNVFSPTATISKDHGWPADDFAHGEDDLRNLLGMDRFEARRAIVEWFKSENLLEEVKPYRHSVGHSYRSHVPIEPYLSDQWYVATTKQIPSKPDIGLVEGTNIAKNSLAGMALRATRGLGVSPMQSKPHGRDAHATLWEGKLRLVPERYTKTYESWNENLRDWCISRQLWWGHRIPVWHKRVRLDSISGSRLIDEGLISAILYGGWEDEAAVAIVSHATGNIIRRARNADVEWPDVSENQSDYDIYVCFKDDGWQAKQALERDGFVQDPDVLDTWFSSGLWPLSTMGWPDQTPELAKWNPTSTLCTAREIITQWVSKMVMFNLYFRDKLPFYDVFIHAMIQDGEGRKMSKSLGNGVDPVDIIESHGADALRFALTAMTTQTQDVRVPVEKDPKTGKNTSPKFENGRNFCNKIWNATRFAMMNLQSDEVPARRERSDEGTDESKWSLADRWIVSRFNRTVAEATAALETYRFDAYAKACYDFFWGDFCDWYLEAIKPAMRDPARAAQTANVLAAVLDGALRLMHPMIPFITEFLWWKLCEIRPERGLPGRIMGCMSKRLITAAWPQVGEFSDAAEFIFPRLQEIIATIRNVRNDYKVDPRKTLTVSIAAPDEPTRQITDNREIIELLAGCTLKDVGPNIAQPPDSARASTAGVEIFIAGLVDRAADAQRQTKRVEELKKQQAALLGRLSNESYTKKAPPHLVQQTRDQLAEVEAELAKLGS